MNSSPVAGSQVTRVTRWALSMKKAGIIPTSLCAALRARRGVNFGVTDPNLGSTRPSLVFFRGLATLLPDKHFFAGVIGGLPDAVQIDLGFVRLEMTGQFRIGAEFAGLEQGPHFLAVPRVQ